VTTLLAVVALFFFGGEVIHGFSAAIIWGVLIGIYSSVFVAGAFLPWMNVRRDIGEDTEASKSAKAAP
jgi:preprotein translocase subunit SecF